MIVSFHCAVFGTGARPLARLGYSSRIGDQEMAATPSDEELPDRVASCAILLRNSRVRLGFATYGQPRSLLSRRATADARVVPPVLSAVRRSFSLHHRGGVVAVGQRGDPAPRRPCRLVWWRNASGSRCDTTAAMPLTWRDFSTCDTRHGFGWADQFHGDLDNLGTLVRPPPRPRAQPRADRGKRWGVRRRTRIVDI